MRVSFCVYKIFDGLTTNDITQKKNLFKQAFFL